MPRLSIVGVPSSAGSYAAGQDLAPQALRSAGLIEALIAAGIDVHDDGDLPTQVWSPDREHPLAQNAVQVTSSLTELADRLGPLLARGGIVLVLGGNCTVALGVIAALRRLGDGEPGLLYFDRHFDLNTRMPMHAIPVPRSNRSPRRSLSRRVTRGSARCQSASSTRRAVPVHPLRSRASSRRSSA